MSMHLIEERACIRGCTVPDVHFAVCPDFNNPDGICRGCAPRVAQDDALICERCYRRLRGCLEDAPDIVGKLRSLADPSKAQVYDRVIVQASKPDQPAPVAADLVDASDDIVRTLRMWEMWLAGEEIPDRVPGLPAGTWAAQAQEIAHQAAASILHELGRIVNDAAAVVAMCDGILTRHNGPDVHDWTIADAIARWPFEEKPRWADQPCPECDLKTVRVIPARRRGAPTRLVCTSDDCGWIANSDDDNGFWGQAFREEVPEIEIHPHDPHWLTLAAASRAAHVTTGTMRRWGDLGTITTNDGRYWAPDVERIRGEREQAAQARAAAKAAETPAARQDAIDTAARAHNAAGWTCSRHMPGMFDTCPDCRHIARARAADIDPNHTTSSKESD